MLDGIPGTLTSTELGYVDGVTSSIQTQLDNISVTNGTLTKTFTAGETATVTLTSNVLVPSVAVTKEVSQIGSTNNDWLVNSSSENYTRYNSAAATTLNFNGFDLTTATYNSVELSVSGQIAAESGMAFNNDGTKMYITDNQTGWVVQYALTTAFDLSTAAYDNKYFYTSSQENAPKGVAFNADGTKMFIVGTQQNQVQTYTLSTGFDVSTASFASAYNSSSNTSSPSDIVFNTDGTKMYLVDRSGQQVDQYALSTGFDVSTASYTQAFSVSSQETAPEAIRFNNDGTAMFVMGESGDDVNEYTLSTGFDVSTASYTRNFSVSSQENDPKGLAFDNVGGKMFVVGANGSAVVEYNLTVTLALGSGSFASADVGKVIEANSGVFRLTSTGGAFDQITAPSNFNQASSGSWQMYGTAFNTTDGDLELAGQVITGSLTAASYVDNYSVTIENNIHAVAFKTDGTKMYVGGFQNNSVRQYTLTTAFDVSTASYDSKTYNVGTDISAIAFSPDGTKMFIGQYYNNEIRYYTLTTAWDVSTASNQYGYSHSSQGTVPEAVQFNSDGTKMMILTYGNDVISEHSLSPAYVLNSSTAYTNTFFSVSSQAGTPRGFSFNSDGTKFFVVDAGTVKVYEYDCSTAYDISTASYSGNEFSVNSQSNDPGDLAIIDSSQRMVYASRDTGNPKLYEYTLVSATYPSGYHAAHTATSTDSTYWTDINSMTASESAGSGNIYYCVSTDDRTTWKIAKGTDGERNIAKNSSGTWQYNSNGTYGSETWTNASVNAELYAIQEAVAYSNTVTTTSGADDLAVVSLTHKQRRIRPNYWP